MKAWEGWVTLLFLLGATAIALLAPWHWVVVLFVALALHARLWGFTISTLAISAVLLGLLLSPGTWDWQGAWLGTIGGMRVVATTQAGYLVIKHAGAAQWLESLRLPRLATAWLGAILIAAKQLGDDARAWQWQMQATGQWPAGKWARARLAAQMLIPLTGLAMRRAARRQEALQLIGVRTPAQFVPIVAFTALAILGRILLLALPNVSLTYAVVFLAGYLHGARVGIWVGLLAMTITNVMVSGFHPVLFATGPAMATLGLLGGLLSRWPHPGAVVMGVIGFFATLWFGVLSDGISWLMVPEYRGSLELLWVRMAAGLAFNLVPALVNGVMFAVIGNRASEGASTP